MKWRRHGADMPAKGGGKHADRREFQFVERVQYPPYYLRRVFHSSHLCQDLRTRGARLFRGGQIQAAGDLDVHRVRPGDGTRDLPDLRYLYELCCLGGGHPYGRCQRRRLPRHRRQMAMEHRRIRILPVLGDLLRRRRDARIIGFVAQAPADSAALGGRQSSPLARACSNAITAQSFSPPPWAMAPSNRSRKALTLGSGTRAEPAAASTRSASFNASSAVNPAWS